MDTYYSNQEVFLELLKRKIYACGTVDISRIGITEEMHIKIDNLAPEKALFYTHDKKLLLCVWRTHKKKLVYILSSLLDSSMQWTERFCVKKKEKISIKRPAILEAYNENMRGVDFFDQQIRYYSFLHRSKKWYLKIAYYFLEVAVLNSYVIYQKMRGEEILKRKQYMISIIHSLLGRKKQNRNPNKKISCSRTKASAKKLHNL